MLFSVVCTNSGCPNEDVEYFMPNQEDPVMCGGCKIFIQTTNTGKPIPEPLPYVVQLSEES